MRFQDTMGPHMPLMNRGARRSLPLPLGPSRPGGSPGAPGQQGSLKEVGHH